VIIIFAVLLIQVLSIIVVPDSYDQLRPQAIELLKHGINEENQAKAIQLILGLLVHFDPAVSNSYITSAKDFFSRFSLINYACFGLQFLVGIALCFRPYTAFGLGKGVKTVKRQETWHRTVLIIIPLFVLMNFVLPAIKKQIGFP
jgi:hypothetical protein